MPFLIEYARKEGLVTVIDVVVLSADEFFELKRLGLLVGCEKFKKVWGWFITILL